MFVTVLNNIITIKETKVNNLFFVIYIKVNDNPQWINKYLYYQRRDYIESSDLYKDQSILKNIIIKNI